MTTPFNKSVPNGLLKNQKTMQEKNPDKINLLSVIRESRKYSYRTAATLADVSASYLHQLEHGVIKHPEPETLYRIANALGVDGDTVCYHYGVLPPDVLAYARKNPKTVSDMVRMYANEDEEDQ